MPTAFVHAMSSSIQPAEPFTVIWGVCPDRGGPPAAPHAFTLLLNGRVIFPLPGGDDANQPGGSAARAAVSGSVRVDRARLLAAGIREADFYRIGTQGSLTVRAVAPGSELAATGTYRIAASVAAPAATFAAPAAHEPSSPYTGDVRAAAWKTAYECAVAVTNQALTDLRLTFTLRETSADAAGAAPMAVESQSITISRASQTLTFAPILKDWTWLADGVWTVVGAFQRGFTYDVTVTGTDEFGNPVSMVRAQPITVAVTVPAEKQALGISANAMFYAAVVADGVAIALAAVPIAGAVAAGIAAGLHLAAEGLGVAAEDPPAPDPAFKLMPALVLPIQHAALAKLPTKATTTWVQAALEFATRRNRMYAIEAKVLGAMKAGDLLAEKDRVDDYTGELRELAHLYRTMATSVDPMVQELVAGGWTPEHIEKSFDVLHAEATSGAWSKEALALTHGGVDLGRLAATIGKVKHEDLDLRSALRRATLALGRAVQAATEDATRRYAELRPEHFLGSK